MADQSTSASFEEITVGDTNDNTLTVEKGIGRSTNFVVTIRVTAGTVKFNTEGDAADGFGATSSIGWFPMTLPPSGELNFQGASASDTFVISV